MKGNVGRVSHKVLDFASSLRLTEDKSAPPPTVKKTEKQLPSAAMLSATDFLSTRSFSAKPRDFVSKNSPPRVPVAAGLPPVEFYKPRRMKQLEKEEEERRRLREVERADAEATSNTSGKDGAKQTHEEEVISRMPQRILMNALSKERQVTAFPF